MATPRSKSPGGVSSIALREWVSENLADVLEKLHNHGAILFRDFSFNHINDFDRFAEVFCPTRLEYVGGNSPRTKVKEAVYTATEYPSIEKISLHNEASYTRNMPRMILFYCQLKPKIGGQTPLADCRKILQDIAPNVKERFAEKRVKYINNLHNEGGIGKSWQDVFQTKDKGRVEQILINMGYDYFWKPDGGLRTSIVADGVTEHPETKESVWINQAEQWHPSCFDTEMREALLSIFKNVEDLPHYALFGDGTPLIEAELDEIRQIQTKQEFIFEWNEKDVLLCDNYLVAHGRRPYVGNRKVFVVIG
jgi:alpha-ketoglutarate-dependent taurine dioxygenase